MSCRNRAFASAHGIEEFVDLEQIRGRIMNRSCVTNEGMVSRL